MVASLIKRQFGVKLSLTSVGRLLHQLGFTCQKPLYRAYQRDAELVEQWKKQVFQKSRNVQKRDGSTIYFQYESGIRSDFHSGTTWALKGKTPVIESTGARFGLNMMAAITPRGQMQFMIVQGTVRAEQICEFLKRLMHGHEDKVFLMWDGHPTHKSKKIKECIASFKTFEFCGKWTK